MPNGGGLVFGLAGVVARVFGLQYGDGEEAREVVQVVDDDALGSAGVSVHHLLVHKPTKAKKEKMNPKSG